MKNATRFPMRNSDFPGYSRKIVFLLGILLFGTWFSFGQLPTPPGERGCDCAPLYSNSNFTRAELESGNPLQEGAVYRFRNIFPGNEFGTVIDALVRIVEYSNGASLLAIDVSDVGIDRDFQPLMNSTNNGDQSVRFEMAFVTGGGGFDDEAVISFFGTPFDIDGDGFNLREYAELSLPDAYFRSRNTLIDIQRDGVSVRGTARNTSTAQGNGGISENPRYTFSNYWESKSKLIYVIGKTEGNTDRFYSLRLDNADYNRPESTMITAPVICGTVSDNDGDPLANTGINVSGSDGSNARVLTDNNGNYRYAPAIPDNLVNITYEVRENDPGNYVSFSDVDGTNDNLITRSINLSSSCGNNFVDILRPLAQDDRVTTGNGQAVEIEVLSNDNNVPATGTLSILTLPTNGTVTINDNGTPNDLSDDTVTYEPNVGFRGTDSFPYQFCDSADPANCSTATAFITIIASPDASNDTASTDEDTPVNIDVLTNDGNVPNSGTLNVLVQPDNGSATVNDNGTPNDPSDDFVTYSPDSGFSGNNSFQYEICNTVPNCGTATVEVTVEEVIVVPTPQAADDTATTNEDGFVIIKVLANDNNLPTAGSLNFTGQPSNGSVTLNNNGTPNDPSDDTITYTPSTGFSGSDSFRYEICNASLNCSSAEVNISIIAGQVDIDSDGDGIDDKVDLDDDNDGILDTDEGCGNLVLNGSFERQDFSNETQFPNNDPDDTAVWGTYIGSDKNTNTLTGWDYTENMDGWVGGEAPSWGSGNAFAPAKHGRQFMDLIGDVTRSGGVANVLSQTITTVPGNTYSFSFYWGEPSITEAGYNYTLEVDVIDANNTTLLDETLAGTTVGAAGGFMGPRTWFFFERTITATTTRTTIQFSSPPNAPRTSDGVSLDLVSVAISDSARCTDTDNDGVPNALDLDSDNDGILDTVEASHGQASTNGRVNGSVGTDGIPDAVQKGPNDEIVNYALTDYDLDGINDVLDLDSDADGIPDNVEAQITVDYIAPNGSVNANGVDTAYPGGLAPPNTDFGSFPDNLDPNADNEGASDSIEAGIELSGNDSDNDGLDDATDATSDYSDVGGTIDNPLSGTIVLPDTDNDALTSGDVNFRDTTDLIPIAVNDASVTNEDEPVDIDVLGNDTNVQSTGSLNVTAQPANGSVAINDNATPGDPSDDSIVYTPNAGFNGNDSFAYEICDGAAPANCSPATVTVTVEPTPDAVNDVAATNEDAPVDIDVLGNDTNVQSTGSLNITAQPANGIVSLNDNATPGDPSDDSIVYTPNPGFNGTDSFAYEICDAANPANCSPATVTVTVEPTPDAVNDTAATNEDTPADIDVLGNDSDVPSTGSLNITGQPTNGSVAINDNATPNDPSDDSIVYTPNAGFSGSDSFAYEICDGATPANCGTANVAVTVQEITVIPVPQPQATDDEYETDQNSTGGIIAVLDNDSGIPTSGTLTIPLQPENGSATINDNGTPDDPSDDTITYTPSTDFSGNDSFRYEICDGLSNCDTASVLVTVRVTLVVPTPQAEDDTATTNEDTPVDIAVLANDTSVPTTGSLNVTTQPENGSTTIDDNTTPNDPSDDSVTYTPNAGFSGNDAFQYEICDAATNCDTATVTITVLEITSIDSDGDGIADSTDLDDDNDGILDTVEGTSDTDNDGIPNNLDLDSDNDGIPDATESGRTDSDGDGHIDYPTPGDPTSMNDSDNDGLDDDIAANPIPDADFDNDGIPNRLDLDSDNDGISDITEAGGTDTDGNGLLDGFVDTNENGLDETTEATPLPLPNSDANLLDNPDYLDIDADDDGLPDNVEAQPTIGYVSPNETYAPNGFNTAYPQGLVPEDTDGDLIPDYRDTDSDNDEIDDVTEGGRGFFIRTDTDGDGLVNGFEGAEVNDPYDVNDEIDDPTLLPDEQEPGADVDYRQGLDTDTDGDGVPDEQEITDGTDPNDPCNFDIDNITQAQTGEYLAADCDGDGVTNDDEIKDGSNPEDPCGADDTIATLEPSGDYLISDCDGDGVTNGDELEDGTDPLDPCDFLEEHVTLEQSGSWSIADCDGDQIQNGKEIEDGTDPNDPCSSNGGRPLANTPCDIGIRTEFVAPDVNNGIFWITNIESYPDNSVRIYNRWGKLVYEINNYDNSGNAFRGISNGSAALIKDDALPVGVYYYVIEYIREGEASIKNGYLYVNR